MDRPRADRFSDRPVDDRFPERPADDRFSERPGGDRFSDRPVDDLFSERVGGDRFSERVGGDRFPDRAIDRFPDLHVNRADDDDERQSRMSSRWSDAPLNQNHRGFPRGGGGEVRHHPYQRPPKDFPPPSGDGSGFRRGPDGFGNQIPMSGQNCGFPGRGGSPEHTNTNKFAKLFIGSVPTTIAEEDIRPLFEAHGDVIEVALIKDRRTGQQQGCCFIKYATSEEADRAIKALHNQYTLPGAAGPIQVRYADGERENLVEHKLFVALINKQATEKEIEEIFSPYGRIEDVYLMKDEMRQSRGCCFVKFSTREMAFAAMKALNGTYMMRGCNQPLTVRLANPKRLRPGEQRGGPAFGGPGFGPRSETSSVIRLNSNHDEPVGESGHPNVWNQMNQQLLGPSSQASNHAFGTHSTVKDVVTPSTALGDVGVTGGPRNGVPGVATPSSSLKSFNPTMTQVHPSVGHQILPLQKPLMPPQDLSSSSHMHHTQQILTSLSHAQTFQAPFGQLPMTHTIGLPSSQNAPSQQLAGPGVPLSASQPLVQQNAHLSLQNQGISAVANQQQLPSFVNPQQVIQQPLQQFSTQVPQVLLQQQAQDLQSSFQSSQQAIFQLQQQLHQMQQSGLTQQQGSQATKQQPSWPGKQSTSSAPATVPAAVMLSTTPVTFSHSLATTVPTTCNWSEHTSPEGFKYYYNSVTRESKWEKPEELTFFEQHQQQQKLLLLQQQQQNLAVQQVQSPSQAQAQAQNLPLQPVNQTQDGQAQMHLRQQAQLQQQKLLLLQQQQQNLAVQQVQSPSQAQAQAQSQPLQPVHQTQDGQAQMHLRQQAQLQLQPSLKYQASGVAGHQNIPGSYYTQVQAASSVIDPARVQQGIQAAQEWAWKNKPAGT